MNKCAKVMIIFYIVGFVSCLVISKLLCVQMGNNQGDRFGFGDNYLHLCSDGIVTLHGNSKVKASIQITAGAAKSPGLKQASFVSYGVDGAWEFDKNADEEISYAIAIPEGIDITVTPKIRVGWTCGEITGDVVWNVNYLYRGLGEAWNDTAQATISQTVSVDTTTAHGLQITDFELALPESTDGGLIVSIEREGTSLADDADGVSYVVGSSFQFTIDKLGLSE